MNTLVLTEEEEKSPKFSLNIPKDILERLTPTDRPEREKLQRGTGARSLRKGHEDSELFVLRGL